MRILSIYRNFQLYFLFLLLPGLVLSACTSVKLVSGLNAPPPAVTIVTVTSTPLPAPVQLAPLPTVQDTNSTPIPATSTPSDPPVCSEKAGSQQTGMIETSQLPKPMRFIVYLPPCYSVDLQTRYPVLYLLHGQGSTEDQWIRIGAATNADDLISTGKIPPFIMVFPYDYSFLQPSEYNFEEVFVEQLVPSIDNSYRTLAGPAFQAIGGLSRGGAWALHIGADRPDLFGAIGGHSASIFIADESMLAQTLLAIPVSQRPRLWLDGGDYDSEHEVIAPFEEFLTLNGFPHEWHEYVGQHEEKYWSTHVAEYLSWYAQGWR